MLMTEIKAINKIGQCVDLGRRNITPIGSQIKKDCRTKEHSQEFRVLMEYSCLCDYKLTDASARSTCHIVGEVSVELSASMLIDMDTLPITSTIKSVRRIHAFMSDRLVEYPVHASRENITVDSGFCWLVAGGELFYLACTP